MIGAASVRFSFGIATARHACPSGVTGNCKSCAGATAAARAASCPRTGWTWQASIEDGMWRNLDALPVDIPAMLGYERGTWYTIHEGIRGLLVPDERGNAVVYMICEPASHYYRIMTRSTRMPIFIEQRI